MNLDINAFLADEEVSKRLCNQLNWIENSQMLKEYIKEPVTFSPNELGIYEMITEFYFFGSYPFY
jgi:hypothetical protein